MMRALPVVLLLHAAFAMHQAEPAAAFAHIPNPPGEGDVSLLETEEKTGGDLNYRVSFATMDSPHASKGDREKYTSADTFKIEIKGKSGTTGAKDLVSHPGMARATDKDPWKHTFGATQSATIKASDVGTVTEIKVTGSGADSWTPEWIKVNSNDAKTGIGNGVYYAQVKTAISSSSAFDAKNDGTAQMARSGTWGQGLIYCDAQFCEERMDKKMGAESFKDVDSLN